MQPRPTAQGRRARLRPGAATSARSHDAVNGSNRKCNAPDKALVQPWSTSMLAEIFMLRLEEAARAAKEAAPHRPDHVAGCEGVLTRAVASPRRLSARPGHPFGGPR